MRKHLFFFIAGILIIAVSCKKKEDDPQPEISTVKTHAVTNIALTSVTLNGLVGKLGTDGTTDHGFVWAETANPDLDASGKQSLGAKTAAGPFTHKLTGLTVGKTYHVRAYATDAQGTVFGVDETFNTLTPTVTDFTPTEGGQGDTLTITGTNFSTTTTDITVKIGSTTITNIVSSTTTEIKLIVPSGITEGTNKVTVTINAHEVALATDFTYWGGLWTQKKDFGGVARIDAISFSVGTKGYIGLGKSGYGFSSGLDDLWEYDPATDTWTQKANYAGGKRTGSVSFVIQDIAFVGLGIDETSAEKKDFWQYNPTTNNWAQLADFAATYAIIGGKAAFSVGFSGFVVKFTSNEFWEITQGAWKQKNNLPFSPTKTSFVLNDIAYIVANDRKLWKYNAATDSWTGLNNFTGTSQISGMSANGKGYIAGGGDDNYAMWEYSPVSDTWAKKIRLRGTIKFPSYTDAFSINNKIYIREGGFRKNTFWEFDPAK